MWLFLGKRGSYGTGHFSLSRMPSGLGMLLIPLPDLRLRKLQTVSAAGMTEKLLPGSSCSWSLLSGAAGVRSSRAPRLPGRSAQRGGAGEPRSAVSQRCSTDLQTSALLRTGAVHIYSLLQRLALLGLQCHPRWRAAALPCFTGA